MPPGFVPERRSNLEALFNEVDSNKRDPNMVPGGAQTDANLKQRYYEQNRLFPEKAIPQIPLPSRSPTPGSIYDKAQSEVQGVKDKYYNPKGPNPLTQEIVDRHRGTMAGMENLQKNWEAEKARGGWKSKYPAGTDFNPQISTKAIARNNVDAWRNKRYDSMFGGRF